MKMVYIICSSPPLDGTMKERLKLYFTENLRTPYYNRYLSGDQVNTFINTVERAESVCF